MTRKISSVGRAVAMVSVCFLGTTVTQAAFFDDFEDGNDDGWLLNEGGGGSNGVEYVNGSHWAYVYTNKSGIRSLTQEFPYEANTVLSFDMYPTAHTGWGEGGTSTYHAGSGVTVTFENSFNIALGSVSFAYATSGSVLPANTHAISNVADHFSGTMAEWAALANVDPSANVADLDLKFWVHGHTESHWGGSRAATGQVRFDNVAVPEPASLGLLGFGWVVLLRRRRLA